MMIIFECTIGDFIKNENGRLYTVDLWKEIAESEKLVFATLDDDFKEGVPVENIVGEVLEWIFTPETVSVVLKILNTPKAIKFKELVKTTPLFLTPVGVGHIMDDIVTNYNFHRFKITTESTFNKATPLVEYHNRT